MSQQPLSTSASLIHSERLVSTFCRLVSIDSPSYQEDEMCATLTDALKSLGLEVIMDDAGSHYGLTYGNLYALVPGTGSCRDLPPILFCCHMDTVVPALGKKAILHEGGLITSDGTTVLGADDLSGVSAILEALTILKENDLDHRPIEIIFSMSEEVYSRGAMYFDQSRLLSHEGYILDLTGPVGTAAYTAPSIVPFTIHIHGKAAHAGFAPETGVHAIAIASAAIHQLPLGHVDQRTTLNIGSIEGGSRTNIVPESCVVHGEVRSLNHAVAMEQLEKTRLIFEEEAARLGGSIDFEYFIGCKAFETAIDDPCTKRFSAACERLGLTPSLVQTFGGSDNNIFSQSETFNGIVLASAMEQCHSCAEYTTVDQLGACAALTLELMLSRD